MRIRPVLLTAVPTAFVLGLAVLPVAAHATGIPYFGPIVGPRGSDVLTCAAGWGALADVVNNAIAFLITILILFIAPFMIAWAGFLYVVSPGNPGMRTKASGILLNTMVGIAIAVAAWLIVNALLTAITVKGGIVGGPPGTVASWTSTMFSTTAKKCLITTADLKREFSQAEGQSIDYSLSSSGDSLTISPDEACAGKGGVFSDEDGTVGTNLSGDVKCANGDFAKTTTKLADASTITGGSCDKSSFSSFGGDAATMSCVCGKESGGNAAAGSGTDKTANGESVSWGLMQINITGTPVSCKGETYNCPKAFSGPYRGSSSRITITDQGLYDKCVTAMKDPQCNLQQAYSMYQLSGTRPWKGTISGC